MGVQFNPRKKGIKSYNHNGGCVLLDEPCFKRGIDCTPCTRIHKSTHKPSHEPVKVKYEIIPQPEAKPVFESIPDIIPESEPVFELAPKKVPVTTPDIIPEIVPKSTVEPNLISSPVNVHNETPDKIIFDEPISMHKKKGLWSKFKDFICSIFKRNNRKPPKRKQPKISRNSTGNIYVWKNGKDGFGKRKVGKL